MDEDEGEDEDEDGGEGGGGEGGKRAHSTRNKQACGEHGRAGRPNRPFSVPRVPERLSRSAICLHFPKHTSCAARERTLPPRLPPPPFYSLPSVQPSHFNSITFHHCFNYFKIVILKSFFFF